MKKTNTNKYTFLQFLVVGASALLLAACSTTTTTETTYAADGVTVASVKTIETSDNAVVIFAQNSAKKSLAIKRGGWFGNIGVNAETNSYGINAGSIDTSIMSVQDSDNGTAFAAAVPAAWNAQKYSIAITKNGVSAEGGSTETSTTKVNETDTNTTTSKTTEEK